MTHTLQKLILAFSISAFGASASPCFAQSSSEPTAPVPANERAQAPKNPVPMTIQEDKWADELRIVSREKAANSNIASIIAGIAQAQHGATLYPDGTERTKFYGNVITDAPSRRNLVSPLLGDFPKALDQKISDLLAAENSSDIPAYKNSLILAPLGWHLVYHDPATRTVRDDDYVLRFAVHVSKIAEGKDDNFLRRANRPGRTCEYISKPRALAAWRSNDYEAVVGEKKLATQACIDALSPLLPELLSIDYYAKLRTAKINCKSKWVECNTAADTTADPIAGKKACKADYYQCGQRDIEPLAKATPVGQCKTTYAACKKAVIDNVRALNPAETPGRLEFDPCLTQYNACIDATK
ncbi:hypothetical protein LXA47_26350 [Massilia sp. P8910]|uniref:hypothetical protein n=1 Tax=Massilia antarctica TaxID=2765360 RepID=UPI001E491BF0|nr:hypothetical protein [Massilia antarctica]MCE3607094.1 hypothetical protein [Massilia antarctica]